jgi:hypothetical protein
LYNRKEVDRVGFEPTTSAATAFTSKIALFLPPLEVQLWNEREWQNTICEGYAENLLVPKLYEEC